MNFIKVLLLSLWLYRGPDDLVVLHLQEEQLPQDFFGGGGGGGGAGFLQLTSGSSLVGSAPLPVNLRVDVPLW